LELKVMNWDAEWEGGRLFGFDPFWHRRSGALQGVRVLEDVFPFLVVVFWKMRRKRKRGGRKLF
jgi:hypothetical protein